MGEAEREKEGYIEGGKNLEKMGRRRRGGEREVEGKGARERDLLCHWTQRRWSRSRMK